MLFRQGGSISKAVFQVCPVQSIQYILTVATHTWNTITTSNAHILTVNTQ